MWSCAVVSDSKKVIIWKSPEGRLFLLVLMVYTVYMELMFLIIISIIIVAGFMSVIFVFRNMRAAMLSKKDKEESSFVFLQNQINEVTRVLDSNYRRVRPVLRI